MPLLRWLVPVVAAAVLVGGSWTLARVAASAQEGLPPRTAAQLLVDLHKARLDGLSGTVVERSDLGLPSIPGGGGSGSADLGSLLSGTHTMRVWLSAPDKARLALLGTFGESDVVMNGRDLWTWSSQDRSATHVTLPAATMHPGREVPDTMPGPGGMPGTPQQAARAMLKAVDPTTKVETTGTAVVAGRRAYELVLTPRDSGTLVGQVRIAVDGRTHVPLRLQVFAKGAGKPAFEIGFTAFDPTRPDAARFRFTPPPGTKVTERTAPPPTSAPSLPGGATPHGLPFASVPHVLGAGWSAVAVGRLPAGAGQDPQSAPGRLSQMMGLLPRVSGSWGSGRLMAGTLFSVLLTDDGRVAAGAVPPSRLYDALAAR